MAVGLPTFLRDNGPILWDVAQRIARLVREGRRSVSLADVIAAEDQRSLARAVEREQVRREIARKKGRA